MKFDSLEERMLYFRGLTDYKLTPNSYVICMIDGRSFSKKIKKKFERPFDDKFINAMNEVAKFVCKEVQGCKLAYVQSDEISFVITDFDTLNSDSFFGYRLCKMQSIIASLATGKFNRLMEELYLAENPGGNINDVPLYQFDCKCWVVPTHNDAVGWLLYRQNDCTCNSMQQAAQAYLPHNRLVGLYSTDQIALLKEKHNIDWYTEYDDGKKYGRFIYKDTETFTSEQYGEYERSVWNSYHGKSLNDEDFREFIGSLIPKR